MEEREEFMVSPKGGCPTLRIAHFLSPSITSIDGPVFDPPSDAFSTVSGQNKHLKVQFRCWKQPQKDWKTWVDNMHSLHHSSWKKVGIYHAIMNSTCIIHRNDDLIYGFAARWCPETNTFVFPWGEATLTLEDMIVLGGYSVLGDPVFSPLESGELKENEKKLLYARTEICKSTSKKASQSLWLRKFMGGGSEIEHEAFLTLWLSRFVFPRSSDNTILKCVIPIAVHLARGTKLALAPAVLASLYTSLSDLRKALVASTKLGSSCKQQEHILEVAISGPFELVQIWVWERFLNLQPEPVVIGHDEPRFAKWHDLRKKDIGNVQLAIEEAADCFYWRPYATNVNSFLPDMLYKGKEEWICLASGAMNEELDVLIRCLRVSELTGIDSDYIMLYLPNRVAMQFGMDQDLPGHVARANSNQIMAWKNYNRPIRDKRLYVPSSLFKTDVTSRYLEWWKKLMSTQDGHKKAYVNWVIPRKLKKKILADVAKKRADNDGLASRSLPTKCNGVKVKDSGDKDALANGVNYKNFMKKKFQKSSANEADRDTLESLKNEVENEQRKERLEQSQDHSTDNRARINQIDGLNGQESGNKSGATQGEPLSAPFLESSFPLFPKEGNSNGSHKSFQFEVRAMKLESRIRNLESMIARYKRGK